ncbi:MAG: hypothetical protein AAFR96_09985 [Planctomycetota bacterium]
MTPTRLIELGEIAPTSIRVIIESGGPPEPTPAIEQRWEAMRKQNPRLFNAPVLSFEGFNAGVIVARRDSYQRLAVQAGARVPVEPAVMQLSVTGLITARDTEGTRHVLVGRRSHATRIYGGLWELGPSGGIDPPPLSQTSLDGLDVFRQLVVEMREETGIPADPDPGPILAITVDDEATSADLVMRIDLARPVEEIIAHSESARSFGWEYETTRWIPCRDFGRFEAASACIPPTTALTPIVERL